MRVEAGGVGYRSVCPEKRYGCQGEGEEVGVAEAIEADDVLVVAEAPVAECFGEKFRGQSALNVRHAAMLRVRMARGSPLML